MIRNGIGLHHFHRFQRLQSGLLRYLVISFIRIMLQVAYISDIPYVTDLVAQISEESYQYVVCNGRPGMPQVRLTIYGRPAHIQPHHPGMNRDEFFLSA